MSECYNIHFMGPGQTMGLGDSFPFTADEGLAGVIPKKYLLSLDATWRDLVLWDISTTPKTRKWNAGGWGANLLVLQTDGNLVLYQGNRATWASNTSGYRGANLRATLNSRLAIIPDPGTGIGGKSAPEPTIACLLNPLVYRGNSYFIYPGDNTPYFDVIMTSGQSITTGTVISPSNSECFFHFDTDGNIRVYGPRTPNGWALLFSTTLPPNSARTLYMQPDGNLVINNNGIGLAWAAGLGDHPGGYPGAVLMMNKETGVLVVWQLASSIFEYGAWQSKVNLGYNYLPPLG